MKTKSNPIMRFTSNIVLLIAFAMLAAKPASGARWSGTARTPLTT